MKSPVVYLSDLKSPQDRAWNRGLNRGSNCSKNCLCRGIVYKKCVRSGKLWWYPRWTTFVNKKRCRTATMFCYDWNKSKQCRMVWAVVFWATVFQVISTQNDVYQRYLEKDFGKIFQETFLLRFEVPCFVVSLFHKLPLARELMVICETTKQSYYFSELEKNIAAKWQPNYREISP